MARFMMLAVAGLTLIAVSCGSDPGPGAGSETASGDSGACEHLCAHGACEAGGYLPPDARFYNRSTHMLHRIPTSTDIPS